MRVIELRAENIKKLSAITIRPETGLVQITGKNGNGKSSTLDALWWCLAGAAHIQAQPIKKGAESGLIRLELGTPGQTPELIATRTFTKKGDADYTTSIKVESADGARFPQPQAVLDKLLGELAFDPLEFTRLKPREQFEALISFVPDVDFKAIADANAKDFEARRDINRSAGELRAAAELIPPLPEGFDAAAVNVDALTDQLTKAADHNGKIAQRKANRAKVTADAARYREDGNAKGERAQALRQEADQLEAESRKLIDQSEQENKRLAAAPPLPAEIDTALLRKQISEARAGEELVRRDAERRQKLAQAEKLEGDADTLTAAIRSRQEAAAKAVQAAKLPVPELGFGNGEILIRGVPFAQASDAEQLRTSIAIAMAKNPKLRVLRIRDGSLLDEDSLKVLETMLDENDYQCWFERVDSSGTVGFVLEDGHLKDAPATPAAPPPTRHAAAPRGKGAAKAAVAAPPAAVEPVAAPPPEPVAGGLRFDDDSDL